VTPNRLEGHQPDAGLVEGLDAMPNNAVADEGLPPIALLVATVISCGAAARHLEATQPMAEVAREDQHLGDAIGSCTALSTSMTLGITGDVDAARSHAPPAKGAAVSM